MFRATWRLRRRSLPKEGAHAEHQDGGTRWSLTRRRCVARRDRARPRAASGADATTVRIWTDEDRIAAVTKVANAWAAVEGRRRSRSCRRTSATIRDDLKTVQAETAPDVIVGAHDWVGELSANGSIVPLVPVEGDDGAVPGLRARRVLVRHGRQAALRRPGRAREHRASSSNTKLAKVPKTWAQLQTQALAFKKKTSGNVGIAVQQGANGDAYHMYPFFSGLCGYIFGTNTAGNLDPSEHRRREPEVPEERDADRPVEQGRPDQLEGRLRRSRRTRS